MRGKANLTRWLYPGAVLSAVCASVDESVHTVTRSVGHLGM